MSAQLDAVLQSVCPTVMVPRYTALEPLAEHGHRYLAAENGLYLEARRPWLHWITPVGPTAVRLPYGCIDPVLNFGFSGFALIDFVTRFIADARSALPNEHAALCSFGTDSGLHYEQVEIEAASGDHISYLRPDFADNRVLAVDIHSHGFHPAFFSATDDADDLDDLKLAIVVGNLDQESPSIVARLVGMGLSTDLSAWAAALLVR